MQNIIFVKHSVTPWWNQIRLDRPHSHLSLPLPSHFKQMSSNERERGQTNTHTQTGAKQHNQVSTNEQQETSTKQERTSTKHMHNCEWKPNEQVWVNGRINERKWTRMKPERAWTTQAIEKGGMREDKRGGRSGSGNSMTAAAGTAAAGQGREQEQERLQQGGSRSISSCRGGTCSRSRGTMCSPPPFFFFF